MPGMDGIEAFKIIREGDSVNKNTPVIKGVMVVAEGGGDTAVQNNISEAIMALFDIELHKIKIVKMSMQED